ncbi:MAG: glycerate kinase, partial [Vulcanimicrobiaceae bacterium]
MRVVVAPDKFKRSLEAAQVADAIDRGLRRARPDLQTTIVPMADGGEGTVAATIAAGAQAVERIVRGPLGSPARAVFALDGPTAVVEMARASGLTLLAPADRDARRASSYGTGELLRAALDAGVTRIVVGIGGSASNDGGAGMLAALGVRLLDARGVDVPLGGAALRGLARIDVTGLDPRLRDVDLTIAADVDNPLCGPTGASAVFGPQKGATRDQVRELDAALAHFADLSAAVLGRDLRDTPGSGAAGGLGFALL